MRVSHVLIEPRRSSAGVDQGPTIQATLPSLTVTSMSSKPINEESTMVEYTDGTKQWFTNNKLHRTDAPAIERANGAKEWFVNGKRHRTDGPAIERAGGTKEWWVHDERHRIDGPAIEHADGTKEWYMNSRLHRVDGPAIEDPNGTKTWWVHGKRHRIDGPALEWEDGSSAWFVRGNPVDKSHVTNIILLIQRAMRRFKRRIYTRRCARMNALKDVIGRDIAGVAVQYLSFI
jgi:hypothetical protein